MFVGFRFGREFESLRLHHKTTSLKGWFFACFGIKYLSNWDECKSLQPFKIGNMGDLESLRRTGQNGHFPDIPPDKNYIGIFSLYALHRVTYRLKMCRPKNVQFFSDRLENSENRTSRSDAKSEIRGEKRSEIIDFWWISSISVFAKINWFKTDTFLSNSD